MPIRLFFPLLGPPPATPFVHGTGLRAVILAWLQAADPQLSAAIHDDPGPKPYTVSPLWPRDTQRGFDLCLLDDRLLGPLVAGMTASGSSIRLGPQQYQLGQQEQIAVADWDELAQLPRNPARIDLELVSPTAHHAPGPLRKSVVLPSPELYFGSWIHRCRLFSPWHLPEDLASLVQERVAVGGCAGQTHAVQLDGKRVFIGFQGTVRFQVLKHRELPETLLQALWLAARTGAYSGTGVETMRGMGQTQLLE